MYDQIPIKKSKQGFSLPVLGIGTWQIGGRFEKDPKTNLDREIASLQMAIKYGLNHIDTAESYANGFTEEIIGLAIKNTYRSSLFLTSKVSSKNLAFNSVFDSFKNSLKRLKTDYLDLYLVHSPNIAIPLEETIKALNLLQNRGLVKHIGFSNTNTDTLKKAIYLSEYPICTNQIYYNLINREPEKEGVLKFCQENKIIVTAYRPLEKGLLFEDENFIKPFCLKYNKNPFQIALNFLISQKNVVTICKMQKQEHLLENLGALNWTLENEDLENLRQNYPGQIDKSTMLPLK